jgi:AraC family transcriptional regulator, transcriptional activator of pobA
MLFGITPGQVHYWQATSPITGTVILFMPDFLMTSPTVRFPQDFSLFDWNTPSGYLLPSQVHPRIDTLLQLLTDEYSHPDTFLRLAAIQNALHLLLIHLQRAAVPMLSTPPRSGDKLFHAFMAQVNTHYVTHRRVRDYAHMLGVTAGHLSDTVSQLSGQTAISVIHQRTVLEAKRMLIHTEQTVSQIAAALAFDDPSYFGRFFKRLTGETPHQFRQKFR